MAQLDEKPSSVGITEQQLPARVGEASVDPVKRTVRVGTLEFKIDEFVKLVWENTIAYSDHDVKVSYAVYIGNDLGDYIYAVVQVGGYTEKVVLSLRKMNVNVYLSSMDITLKAKYREIFPAAFTGEQ